MKIRFQKQLILAAIPSGSLLSAGILIKADWDVLSPTQLLAGILTGAAVSFLGFNVYRRLKTRFSPDGRSERVDKLPEPLAVGECLYRTILDNPLDGWLFHNLYQVPSELTCVQGVFRFVTHADTADEWDYIYLDTKKYHWSDYSWQMRAKRDTAFREFAFNFRYQDFNNRYRYRFEDDKIFFDKKVKGVWTNNIASFPFPMTLGQWYALRIDVCASLCRCYVDGHLCMENTDTDLGWGSVCVILWEDDGRRDVKAEVGPMSIHAIKLEASVCT